MSRLTIAASSGGASPTRSSRCGGDLSQRSATICIGVPWKGTWPASIWNIMQPTA